MRHSRLDVSMTDLMGVKLTLRDAGDGTLIIGMQQDHVAITKAVLREDVQQLVSFFDEWLFDSRPS